MLISKYVYILPNRVNKSRYIDKAIEIKEDYLKLRVSDLYSGSTCLVETKCDRCGKDKTMSYRTYMKINKDGKTFCPKCAVRVREETLLKNYGVTNVFQLDHIKDKIKQTNQEKYGVDFPSQRESHKEKYLYGDSNYFYINGTSYEKHTQHSSLWKKIRKEIIDRDGKCMICSSKDNLQIHHLYNYKDYEKLRFEQDNILTLCKECHNSFHSDYPYFTYGRTSPHEFKEWLIKTEGATTIPKGSTTTINTLLEVHSFVDRAIELYNEEDMV